jgi:hypothetical protein
VRVCFSLSPTEAQFFLWITVWDRTVTVALPLQGIPYNPPSLLKSYSLSFYASPFMAQQVKKFQKASQVPIGLSLG